MPNPHRLFSGGRGSVQRPSERPPYKPNPAERQRSVVDELIAEAVGVASFQSMLERFPGPGERKQRIMLAFQRRLITGPQAALLIAENGLKAA